MNRSVTDDNMKDNTKNGAKPLTTVLLPLITALIWGTAFVMQDVCADRIPAMAFNFLRFFIAIAFLLAVYGIRLLIGRRKGIAPVRKSREYRLTMLKAAVPIGAALGLASILQQTGMQLGTDAGKSGFITALYIVLVPVGGLFLGKKVRPVLALSILLALAGLYLLCVKGGFTLAPGDLLTLLCAVCFTVQILLIDRFGSTLDSIDLCCGEFFVGGVISLVGMLIFEKPDFSAVGEVIWPLLYVAVLSSGVAYLLQIVAQKQGDPALVSLLFSMESVFSVIGGAVILHQTMSASEYIGCGLILAGVIIAQILPGSDKRKDR